jgi:hypothetical protein
MYEDFKEGCALLIFLNQKSTRLINFLWFTIIVSAPQKIHTADHFPDTVLVETLSFITRMPHGPSDITGIKRIKSQF